MIIEMLIQACDSGGGARCVRVVQNEGSIHGWGLEVDARPSAAAVGPWHGTGAGTIQNLSIPPANDESSIGRGSQHQTLIACDGDRAIPDVCAARFTIGKLAQQRLSGRPISTCARTFPFECEGVIGDHMECMITGQQRHRPGPTRIADGIGSIRSREEGPTLTSPHHDAQGHLAALGYAGD